MQRSGVESRPCLPEIKFDDITAFPSVKRSPQSYKLKNVTQDGDLTNVVVSGHVVKENLAPRQQSSKSESGEPNFVNYSGQVVCYIIVFVDAPNEQSKT